MSRLVDTVVLQLVYAPLAIWFGWPDARLGVGFQLVLSAAYFAYDFIAVARWGQTFGKYVTRTRVVDYATDQAASARQSALRAVLPMAAGAVPFIGPLASLAIYLAAIIDEQLHQGLHDRLAGTLVVKN